MNLKAKEGVIKFFVEIVIIFFGITLSFLFEEFREGRKERQLKKEVIISLIDDIKLKKLELEGDRINIQETIDPIDSCLLLSKMNQPLSVALVENLVSSISYDFGSFTTTTPTYVSLATSALWQQLPDTIKRQVFNLYNGDFTYVENTILKTNDFTVYLKNHFFTIHHFSFFSLPGSSTQLESIDEKITEQITSSLKDPEFRSAILNIRNERIKTIRVQKWAVKNSEKVVANLKKYLNEM
jgi:hypothetical protein